MYLAAKKKVMLCKEIKLQINLILIWLCTVWALLSTFVSVHYVFFFLFFFICCFNSVTQILTKDNNFTWVCILISDYGFSYSKRTSYFTLLFRFLLCCYLKVRKDKSKGTVRNIWCEMDVEFKHVLIIKITCCASCTSFIENKTFPICAWSKIQANETKQASSSAIL